MVIRRTDMKRKRKEVCVSPLLDDSPKRTKVHAQRKFAQGSNVNSPVITPVKELESESANSEALPEPVELLPIKRPNTEDFLTFLCFRGTPILPPTLNFFNTASIVDTNGQVHEIKSESSPKNGPIDITKCGNSSLSDKPFIAFGVRKRADPIVISRQMDRKRRHALAIQALRRKYQEQKMAKIRALTISKLSEKSSGSKTPIKASSSVVKTETVLTKKTNNLVKTKQVKVVAKQIKVTETLKTTTTTTTTKLVKKPKMCLRSFRGKFVQKELPFRNKPTAVAVRKAKESSSEGEESDEKKEVVKLKSKVESKGKQPIAVVKKVARALQQGSRITRSSQLVPAINPRQRQQIKKRILLTAPKAKVIVKPRSLRSTTIKKTVMSQKQNTLVKLIKQTKPEPPKVVPVKKIKEPTPPKVVIPPKKEPKKEVVKPPKIIPAEVKKAKEVVKVKSERTLRPSRKTKEAAAIYMELLSQKLVHDSKIDDDDNISFDSFPELPNVKKTEQRENELKAQVKSSEVEVKKPQPCDEVASTSTKRATRNSAQHVVEKKSDSDKSFHMDVKVPKNRKLTRSKGAVKSEETASVKAKGKKKVVEFSDSDEEPLSKLKKEASEAEVKPKRECAKRPQNYLVFSSSEEEEKPVQVQPPDLLSSKDISKRFGKGKVNMSNEQIEQWIKDSVLATTEVEPEPKPEKKEETKLDRKLIFKKDKKDSPNKNAFSPDNESSVYAFGEEEPSVSTTPFRRPSTRRPSSTATSRSEDESNFRKPKNKNNKVVPKLLDLVPSSPSASSSSSVNFPKKALKPPICVTDFPRCPAQLVEAPVFHPTEQEFQDPIEYIERIRVKAEQFGVCRIVPPASFKPECKVTDDMRFTASNQYVHKMLHRWGPNFKELQAIKKYLATQNVTFKHPPWIGGMEIDLPRLYQTVQTLGGLKEVIEKKKWPRVSELMKIPKSAQDRVTKLDDIYCKYLLPYDTLSPDEREKLFHQVETEWAKRESKSLMKAQRNLQENSNSSEDEENDSDDDESEECIMKGRNMALNAFYRIARNTMSMHFRNAETPSQDVESEFWKHVTQRQNHVCVHSGSIDSGNWGYGFAVSKNSPFARHAWNLKILTNNSSSMLRSMGPIMGVTVPTLHVGMVFSACCWYRDPHGLPWIEYLHTGASKIWYAVPDGSSSDFHAALKKLVPNYCRNKELWLPSDTAMVPPNLLVESNCSLARTIQEPGQFVVVFPKAFTSNLSTGYVVSESVYFAPPSWLKTAKSLFEQLKNSCEPSMFSFERLLVSMVNDGRCSVEVLREILPHVKEICDKEVELRRRIGRVEEEKLKSPDAGSVRKRKKVQEDDGDYECEVCRMSLFISMVLDKEAEVTYCLDHAVELLDKMALDLSKCKLMFTYDLRELDILVERIKGAIEAKLQKKVPNKYAGMPTLLTH